MVAKHNQTAWRGVQEGGKCGRSGHLTTTVSEFHAGAPQATASEGFAQDPYSNLRSFGRNPSNLPLNHHAQKNVLSMTLSIYHAVLLSSATNPLTLLFLLMSIPPYVVM